MPNHWTTLNFYYFFSYVFSLTIIAYILKHFFLHRPSYYKLKFTIDEQENLIKSQKHTIKHLYDNIFELEELIERLMDELKHQN